MNYTDTTGFEGNDPEEFQHLSEEEKNIITSWIDRAFIPRKTPNFKCSSYGLKHSFSSSEQGFYITNGIFKGAMSACGYLPHDRKELNWHFGISQKSPVFSASFNRK